MMLLWALLNLALGLVYLFICFRAAKMVKERLGTAAGLLAWKLLGVTLFTQRKTFSGLLLL